LSSFSSVAAEAAETDSAEKPQAVAVLAESLLAQASSAKTHTRSK